MVLRISASAASAVLASERLQLHVHFVVVHAPGIVRLLGAPDLLRHRVDERLLLQFAGERVAEAHGFVNGRARHGGHVDDEMALLQVRQKLAAEERHGGERRRAQRAPAAIKQRRGPFHYARA